MIMKKKSFLKFSLTAIMGLVLACVMVFAPAVTVLADNAIGKLDPTPGMKGSETTPKAKFEPIKSGTDMSAENGPIALINVVLAGLAIVAGVALLFNIIAAALSIILSPLKPGKLMEAVKRILLSILGLVLIALGWFIVAFVSQTLFGDKDYLLEPEIKTTEIREFKVIG